MERQGRWSAFVVKNLRSGTATVGIAGWSNVPTEGSYLYQDGPNGAISLAPLPYSNDVALCNTANSQGLDLRIGKLPSWFSSLNGRRKPIGTSSTLREHAVSLRLLLKLLFWYIWTRRLAGFGPSPCWKNPLKPSKASGASQDEG